MTVAPEPRTIAKVPPTDREMNRKIAAAIRALSAVGRDYEWLYTSGYRARSMGTVERTRRDVKGAEHGLEGAPDTELPFERIREMLADVGTHIDNVIAEAKGAAKGIGRTANAIYPESKMVADDPLEVAPASKGEIKQLHRAQERRNERAANAGRREPVTTKDGTVNRDGDRGRDKRGTPWASDETHG